MSGQEIVHYFFDRVIGSTVLSDADRKHEIWDRMGAWLQHKAPICSDAFIKKLACDIVLECEDASKNKRPFPAYPCKIYEQTYHLSDYMRTHKGSSREGVERALAGTLWDMKAR